MFNDYVDAALAGLFIFVVVSVVVYGVLAVLRARRARLLLGLTKEWLKSRVRDAGLASGEP